MFPLDGIAPAAAAPADTLGLSEASEAPKGAARATDAVGFDAVFAALLANAPAPHAGAGPSGAFASPDAARTAEWAAYAARGLPGGASGMMPAVGGAVEGGAGGAESGAESGAEGVAAGLAVPATLTSAQVSAESAIAAPSAGETQTPVIADTPALGSAEAPPPATEGNAAAAMAAAAEAAARAAMLSPRLAGVDAELQERLERVIARMQREFGHLVEIVEGVRTQARQDALFAQGRTAPGPVVTWTRDSAHLDGRAVDVRIDGSYDNAEAFKRLAQIAKEEGLRTLGPRDPGHLELPDHTAPTAGPGPDTARAPGLARVARMAEVADVAAVASPSAVATPAAVATVARVAAVASTSGAARTSGAGARVAAAASQDSGTAGDVAARSERPAPTAGLADAIARLTPALAGTTSEAGATTTTLPITGVDMAARLEAVARIRDAQASQPVSRLVMDVPDATGGMDRIAVHLRGGRVDAALTIADPMAAARLASRADVLAQALEARGYDAGAMQVNAARVMAPEALDLTRLAGLALEREGARTVASFLQDVSGGGLRDRQGSPGRQSDSSHTPRDGGPRDDTPRRQPRRDDPGAR